ncbi:hypothetical protein A7978_04895 (plasmid) [Borrelia turicatae]|uniref:Lipoprotein n=1 Tax=Borrelia turicatae TaxID=142 RepID=A0A172XD10_BORTU|nr:hypothetical protein [Borrelia turicatae]ANF34448.1 hypothetical protein A7978_04895 [Borrelia turicatae]UPA15528.1 hypothetical protein btBTE5EL_001213 [Borrelia turicatae]
MLKIKHLSVLLILIVLLLILVMSCDVGSKINPLVENVVAIMRPLRGLRRSARMRNDFGIVDSNLKFSINNLLDEFQILDTEKQVITYILSVVVNPVIGWDEDYKTYNEHEFYNMLNSLGASRVKEIIKVNSKIFQAQERAISAILNLSEDTVKQQLQDSFDTKNNEYELHLKEAFNGPMSNDVYLKIVGSNYADKFDDIRYRAIDIGPKGVYVWLSVEQKKVVDYMKSIAMSFLVGEDRGLKIYTSSGFDNLLNGLGLSKVEEIIKIYLQVVSAENEAYAAINRIKKEKFKEGLLYAVSVAHRIDSYQLYLKELFNDSIPENIYRNFIKNSYFSELTTLLTNVINNSKVFVEFEKFYANLSAYDKEVITNIQNILIDVKIGRSEGYRAYNDVKFAYLLGSLGAAKIRDIIDVHLNILKAQNEASVAVNKLNQGERKEKLQIDFNSHVNGYPLHLKSLYHDLKADNVYNNVIKSDYANKYLEIKNAAEYIAS